MSAEHYGENSYDCVDRGSWIVDGALWQRNASCVTSLRDQKCTCFQQFVVAV